MNARRPLRERARKWHDITYDLRNARAACSKSRRQRVSRKSELWQKPRESGNQKYSSKNPAACHAENGRHRLNTCVHARVRRIVRHARPSRLAWCHARSRHSEYPRPAWHESVRQTSVVTSVMNRHRYLCWNLNTLIVKIDRKGVGYISMKNLDLLSSFSFFSLPGAFH